MHSIRIFSALFLAVLACPAWSITCYITLAKDNCWSKYTVSMNLIDSKSNSVIATVSIPPDKQWVRQVFPCKLAQKLTANAQFAPVFWETDKDKTYTAGRFWFLPEQINLGDTAWNVSMCYPADFSLVPMPPEATSKCACDFSVIPAIPPG